MNETHASVGRITVLGRRSENQARCVTLRFATCALLPANGPVEAVMGDES